MKYKSMAVSITRTGNIAECGTPTEPLVNLRELRRLAVPAKFER
jgi:hypothetical protein